MNTKTIKGKSLGILLSLALILSLAAVVLPATPVHAASTWYVATTGNDTTGTGTSSLPYKTITKAITSATAGDTIIVAAGTYSTAATGEVFPINVNKTLTIKSASGAATTNISPLPADLAGFNVTAVGATIGGSGTGFTILPGGRGGIYADVTGGDAITVQGCIFKSDTAGERRGMWFDKLWNSALITGNSFATPMLGTGIQVVNADGATISNNTVATLTLKYSFLTFKAEAFIPARDPTQPYAEYVATAPSTIKNVSVTGNSVTGMAASRYAIRFAASTKTSDHGEPQAQTLTVDASGVTISGNTFTSNGKGVGIDADKPAPNDGAQIAHIHGIANILINYNKFTGNTLAVDNGQTDQGNVNAEVNWWGDNSGPQGGGGAYTGSGDPITTFVDATPWSQVAVTYPTATGVRMKGGTPYNVTWTSYSSTSATATLYYSTNGGSSYTTIGSVGNPAQGANTYSWSVPAINNTTCKIKVTITDGVLTYSDESDNNFTIDSTNPSVTLGPPVGGECWIGNTAHNLTWIGTDNLAGNLNFVLEYSLNNGSTWVAPPITTMTNQVQGSYTYSWTTPAATNSYTCKVRVTASEYACALNTATATSNAFTIDSTNPSITLTSPIGGETWTAGETRNITWNASDNLPGNLGILIEFNSSSGWSTVATLTNQAQATGTYSWTVPCGTATSQIRVTATDCAGNPITPSTSPTFTILDATAPTVTITSPNGGERWAANSTQSITWTATDNCAGTLTYNLYYCTSYDGTCANCNIPIASLAAQPQGANSYPWIVPNTPSDTCRVRITATDASSNTGSDCSDNNFSIVQCTTPPTVTLTAPNGGQTWQAGTCQTISWTANDLADSTRLLTYLLAYSSNGGVGWSTIATLCNQEQGTRSFNWAVPNTPTATYLVKVTATACGSTSAQSAAVFSVTAAASGVITSDPITLKAGWNLISLPLMPTCTSIESVLADALCRTSSVWYYNTASGTWSSYAPGAPSSLTTMTDGKGYWVYLSAGADVPLTFQGRKCPAAPAMPPQYSYTAGWNLVGFKSTAVAAVQDYLGLPCPSTVYSTPIYEYNTTTGNYDAKACGNNMAAGKGYWVYYFSSGTVSPGCN